MTRTPADEGARPPVRRIAVIGGGAAGLMAAASLGEFLRDAPPAEVLVIERNRIMGRKLRITGKGRCNLTNDCGTEEFLSHVMRNASFLRSALSRFSPRDTMAYFEGLGVPLKTERGRRVFPASDRAGDVADALTRACRRTGAVFLRGLATEILTKDGAVSGVRVGDRVVPVQAAVLCAGGCSYPATGSDGNGYRLASRLGHTVSPPVPSLVPLVCEGDLCRRLAGLSLRNARLQARRAGAARPVFDALGEMLFTPYGATGPLVLAASARMPDVAEGAYELHVNLKPGLDARALDARILSDFGKYANRDLVNALRDLLPLRAIEPVAELAGLDPRGKAREVTREGRLALGRAIHDLVLRVARARPIAEAIVTRGGVEVREVFPGTMESRLARGLCLAGEILDTDAETGGYNLQIAFSTARLAARFLSGYAAGPGG